ncbi:hypothetical protein P7F88_25075 [Vibrio hannami]|uniref:phage tail assembly protein n=1 Tax=Vibrio hannami TaxID=2717094 RepID=UPI00241095EE|nr:phage tail assembly protein [Vibrio hannami]MDG3089137.1 hypothetical protein [Vibrio hannami]
MNKELERIKASLQKSEKDYQKKTITLLESLDGVSSVTVRAPTLNEDLELSDADGQRDEVAMVALVTGLEVRQVEEIASPDWNNIVEALNAFLSKTSYELAGKQYKPKEKKITLLFTEQEKEVLFCLPTVGITRRAKKIQDATKRLKFYLAQITELSPQEIEEMPLPDYRMLDAVVTDFLNRTADYFQ